MSKKSKKRQSRKRSTPRASTAAVQEATGGKGSAVNFNPDYSQTIKDLKRIGLLASTFFVILVILSFFLR
jgi:hypothetical protein